MATHQRKGGIAVLRNPRTGELKVVAYSRGTQYRYGSAENDALYKDWEVISPKEGGSLTAHWLPTTTHRAYGEHLPIRTPGVRSRAVLAGETFEVWARRIGAQDTPYWRSWYLQDKQSRGLMTPEEQTNYLKKQGWSNSIGAYGEHLKTRTPLNQALSQLLAPLKNWLSNYPRLPQSTIPTPTVEYPAPGRPPVPGEPGYQNPFAWRRKNNDWW